MYLKYLAQKCTSWVHNSVKMLFTVTINSDIFRCTWGLLIHTERVLLNKRTLQLNTTTEMYITLDLYQHQLWLFCHMPLLAIGSSLRMWLWAKETKVQFEPTENRNKNLEKSCHIKIYSLWMEFPHGCIL